MPGHYSQDEIESLIACEKHIVIPPKKQLASQMGSQRNEMRVANDGAGEFRVFMRVSEAFEEDFSIGLKYEPTDRDGLILLRFNGPHGNYLDADDPTHPHNGFHIHRASAESLLQGRKAEAGGKHTTEYASFHQALRCFLKHSNIKWSESHFPDLVQQGLFDGQ